MPTALWQRTCPNSFASYSENCLIAVALPFGFEPLLKAIRRNHHMNQTKHRAPLESRPRTGLFLLSLCTTSHSRDMRKFWTANLPLNVGRLDKSDKSLRQIQLLPVNTVAEEESNSKRRKTSSTAPTTLESKQDTVTQVRALTWHLPFLFRCCWPISWLVGYRCDHDGWRKHPRDYNEHSVSELEALLLFVAPSFEQFTEMVFFHLIPMIPKMFLSQWHLLQELWIKVWEDTWWKATIVVFADLGQKHKINLPADFGYQQFDMQTQ